MSDSNRKKGTINKGNADNQLLIKSDTYANKVLESSRQLDEFNYSGDIIRPPYEPKELIALIERNDTLKQNIEALAANVANFGHGIKYQDEFDYGKAPAEIKKEADASWETLRRLYKYVNPLSDFGQLIYKMAIDMYSFGWGMLEIIRNGAGEARSVEYCRACNFRLVNNNHARSEIKVWEETERGYEQNNNTVRFKKFVQIISGKKVYFKEFGDQRPMSCVTGEYSESVPPNELATEIAYLSIHSSYTDYGVPYWINTAVTASGNIMSELLNYKYFQDGRILPMAVVVSGGQLTESSAQAISEGKGIDNAYKVLILEAAPFEEDEQKKLTRTDSEPRVTVDIKSLTDTTNKDSLFREYQKDGKEKIRDSMRLPPIYTGASSDYNRATADTARQISEEQIFIPERRRICSVFNKIINNELGIRYCELYLKGPDISDTEQKARMLEVLNVSGVLTPNMLLPAAEEILGKDIEPWNDKLGNVPFELTKMQYQRGYDTGEEDNESSGEDDVLKSEETMLDELCKLVNVLDASMEADANG